MGDAARDRMMSELVGGSEGATGDARDKTLLVRGCDPQMAARAKEKLPPLLGGASMVTATTDDEFLQLLQGRSYSAVCFAPGACRHNAAGRPIPGQNSSTAGWTLVEYRAKVAEALGDTPIVESTEESELIPKLRAALGLPAM